MWFVKYEAMRFEQRAQGEGGRLEESDRCARRRRTRGCCCSARAPPPLHAARTISKQLRNAARTTAHATHNTSQVTKMSAADVTHSFRSCSGSCASSCITNCFGRRERARDCVGFGSPTAQRGGTQVQPMRLVPPFPPSTTPHAANAPLILDLLVTRTDTTSITSFAAQTARERQPPPWASSTAPRSCPAWKTTPTMQGAATAAARRTP